RPVARALVHARVVLDDGAVAAVRDVGLVEDDQGGEPLALCRDEDTVDEVSFVLRLEHRDDEHHLIDVRAEDLVALEGTRPAEPGSPRLHARAPAVAGRARTRGRTGRTFGLVEQADIDAVPDGEPHAELPEQAPAEVAPEHAVIAGVDERRG